MPEVNLQLVREFFELNLFSVLTPWQQGAPAGRAQECALLLFAENTAPSQLGPIGPVLTASDLAALERAAVEVRAWHAERMYPSVIEANPVLFHAASGETRALADEAFRGQPFATVLVVSELPINPELRARAVELLGQGGIDHIIEFQTVLQDLLLRVSAGADYAASTTLQLLRLLKRYGLTRDQQLEFLFRSELRPLPPAASPDVDMPEAGESEGE